ncbi:bifunctional DNA primase/polymerase [Streptomyces sp. NPDC092296]|uniref:bifunctional DNA primase/polymerase n=1 Tax=Streptomyces sp. NPDC092296 TaxID=3366012 RepID=UPI0038064A4E
MDIWTYESVEYVTVAGEAWLASASEYPRSVRALLQSRPWAPVQLPCGRAFDVVSLPDLPGRRVLEALWRSGPGCGPVAAGRGRILLFAAVGTAERLRPLPAWEEWGPARPVVLCHGLGDTITVPPVQRPVDGTGRPGAGAGAGTGAGAGRWIVAPDRRDPWLPDAPALLRACVRAAHAPGAARPAPRAALPPAPALPQAPPLPPLPALPALPSTAVTAPRVTALRRPDHPWPPRLRAVEGQRRHAGQTDF